MNPIEKLFARIKHCLRDAQARARDADSKAIAKVLATVMPQECNKCFISVWYERI